VKLADFFVADPVATGEATKARVGQNAVRQVRYGAYTFTWHLPAGYTPVSGFCGNQLC